MRKVGRTSPDVHTRTQLTGNSIKKVLPVWSRGNVDVPVGDYPDHWIDDYHEADGRTDARGISPQDGVEILEMEMGGLCRHGG